MQTDAEQRASILIVDDSETCRAMLREMLTDKYNVLEAGSGIEALQIIRGMEKLPELVLLDIIMPEMDGYTLLMAIKNDRVLKEIPVMCITVVDEEYKGLNAGAVDYISKPYDPQAVKLRVANQIELTSYRRRLEVLVAEEAQELVATKETVLETLADMIEYRNLETGMHIKRTQKLTELLLKQLAADRLYGDEIAETDMHAMIKASALHDIGKIGIPDSILLKPGRLTPDEFKIIETHTVIGSNIFRSMRMGKADAYFNFCYDISRYHHEHWDGNGYPDRLMKRDIPLSARILALVDVYDALVSKRCYKDAIPHEKAIKIISDGAGNHFDPDIVQTMLAVEAQIKAEMKRL